MRWVAAVVCSGQCSASGNSVSEGWQVWREETNYVRGFVCDFQEVVSISEGEQYRTMGSVILWCGRSSRQRKP